MGIKSVDAGMLKAAVLASAKRLESKKEWINELNVFPVPDGDTGTNMTRLFLPAPFGAPGEIPALFCRSCSAALRKRSSRLM